LGGAPGTRPLVVDPFAGGGAIPLEALRVGADAFASDLNPVAVLLNKVVLEYIPKYGQRLADEVRKQGQWIKEQAEKELAEFYPKDPDGATPIAYLWARTITCEGPGCGTKVPMVNQMWLKKRGASTFAYQFSIPHGKRQIDVDIVENPRLKDVNPGTAKQGDVTCPRCGYTTSGASVRAQGLSGNIDTRLMAVVLSLPDTKTRKFRKPTSKDIVAIKAAERALSEITKESSFPTYLQTKIPLTELRRISVPLYGLDTFTKLFTSRQRLALSHFETVLKKAFAESKTTIPDAELHRAVYSIVALTISNILHYNMNLSTYLSNGMVSAFIQGTSLAMRSDFAEANPLMTRLVGGFDYSIKQIEVLIEVVNELGIEPGHAEHYSATQVGLPNDLASLIVTDPPYYDSVPYSHLSDVFYIWLRSCFPNDLLFRYPLIEKVDEIVEDRAHSRSPSIKRAGFYEQRLAEALLESRRIVGKDRLMVVVFAHKSTRGWEAMLNALLSAHWTITSSWPIDTERPARMNAYQNASLLSSVHVVCRPLDTDEVGDWRDVLTELPRRIHEWMPRLAAEGVVGADAIFACLGPALEVFSRYSHVEKASGEPVTLREYLEQVWAAVSREALTLIFSGGDVTGFEEDARLTAMWLWTLSTNPDADTDASEDEEPAADDDEGTSAKTMKSGGFMLEYDAARKIAQGLGAHMEQLKTLIEVKGDKARLLPVRERMTYLIGGVTKTPAPAPANRKSKKAAQPKLFESGSTTDDEVTQAEWGALDVPAPGATILDRIHQSMLLFNSGQGEALKRFLVENGAGSDQRFWKLAQALSALYPAGTDEKRWVDGVLARKKGLGF